MDFDLDDDPGRIQRDAVWQWLSTEAYWGRWRKRDDIEAQLDSAWRVVGAYRRDTGDQIAFARAVSDGVGFAYLADVYVQAEFAGQGIGNRLLSRMIEEGPGRDFRWDVAADVSTALLRHVQDEGFDPAFSSNADLDYSFGIPLTFLGIEGPIIPIYVNAYVPPQPRMERCFALGQAIGRGLKARTMRGYYP